MPRQEHMKSAIMLLQLNTFVIRNMLCWIAFRWSHLEHISEFTANFTFKIEFGIYCTPAWKLQCKEHEKFKKLSLNFVEVPEEGMNGARSQWQFPGYPPTHTSLKQCIKPEWLFRWSRAWVGEMTLPKYVSNYKNNPGFYSIYWDVNNLKEWIGGNGVAFSWKASNVERVIHWFENGVLEKGVARAKIAYFDRTSFIVSSQPCSRVNPVILYLCSTLQHNYGI